MRLLDPLLDRAVSVVPNPVQERIVVFGSRETDIIRRAAKA
jgi:hypothetical protein